MDDPRAARGAGSLQTLSDLVDTQAFKDQPGDGYYSTKSLDRFLPSKDLETVTRANARYNQVTSTYLGEIYADAGVGGAVALSAFLGLVNGLLYRWFRRTGGAMPLLLYAYAAFWLVFSIFLGYWTTHGVWLADLPLLVVVGWAMGRRPAERRALAAVPASAPDGVAISHA